MLNNKKAFSISLYLNDYRYKIFMTKSFQIPDLLEFFNYQKELVIVERNGRIQNSLKTLDAIRQEDRIEIITIVGGG